MDTVACPHCGKQNDQGDRLCIHCGRLIDSSVPQPTESSTSAAEQPPLAKTVLSPPPTVPPFPPLTPSIQSANLVARPSNGIATASMVLGILGIVLVVVPVIGLILAILAMVFGALGISKANAGSGNRGQAIAGLVLGGAGVILTLLIVAAVVNIGNHVIQQISSLSPQAK